MFQANTTIRLNQLRQRYSPHGKYLPGLHTRAAIFSTMPKENFPEYFKTLESLSKRESPRFGPVVPIVVRIKGHFSAYLPLIFPSTMELRSYCIFEWKDKVRILETDVPGMTAKAGLFLIKRLPKYEASNIVQRLKLEYPRGIVLGEASGILLNHRRLSQKRRGSKFIRPELNLKYEHDSIELWLGRMT